VILNESEMKRTARSSRGRIKVPKGLRKREPIPPLMAPIEQLTEDCIAIQKNSKKKMSSATLNYLKNKGIISGDQYIIYCIAQDKPEDRKIISELNTIEHINLKLLELYESLG
jgi:hypothetical protein